MAFSQEVRKFEFEAAIGTNFGIRSQGEEAVREGVNVVLELRHNYNSRLDFGIQFFLGSYDFVNERADAEICVRNMVVQPVVDYNFRQGKKVNPFAGAGLGLAVIDFDYNKEQEKSVCFMPRVGVELFRHLRVALDYKLLKQKYGFWNVSVGVALGGGRKK